MDWKDVLEEYNEKIDQLVEISSCVLGDLCKDEYVAVCDECGADLDCDCD